MARPRSTLRLSNHLINPGELVIEVWFAGRFIATVTPADGPGVKVLSKYPQAALPTDDDGVKGTTIVMSIDAPARS